MRLVHYLFVVALVAVLGCADEESGRVTVRPGEPDIIGVKNDDPEMAAATQKAKQTIGVFISRLKAKKPGEAFHIKREFETRDGGGEHIWVDDIEYQGGMLHGKVGNTPFEVDNLKLGDAVTIKPSELSDWMIYTADGKMEGAFTNAVLEKRAAERK